MWSLQIGALCVVFMVTPPSSERASRNWLVFPHFFVSRKSLQATSHCPLISLVILMEKSSGILFFLVNYFHFFFFCVFRQSFQASSDLHSGHRSRGALDLLFPFFCCAAGFDGCPLRQLKEKVASQSCDPQGWEQFMNLFIYIVCTPCMFLTGAPVL